MTINNKLLKSWEWIDLGTIYKAMGLGTKYFNTVP
jgi:hypothetical protein